MNKDYEKDDYYTVLGVVRQSTKEQIKVEYYIQMKALHPDTNPDTPPSQMDQLHAIQTAYQVLSDESSRRDYHHYLDSGLQVSYDFWRRMHQHSKCMHWASPKKQVPLPPPSSDTP